MNKCLIVIDMQNDFIDGSLGTPEAQAIMPNVCKKIDEYNENQYDVFYTQDTHTEHYLKTPEGTKLPIKHCIINTHGWQIHESIAKHSIGYYGGNYLKKTFESEELIKDIVEWHNSKPYDEIEICGLCTDICVISNVIPLKNALYNEFVDITVDASCCAGSTPERHKAALEVMKSCQINVINE